MINTGSKGFIGNTTASVNPYDGGGAQNAARALGSLGKTLSKMGNDGFQVLMELQEAKNAKVIAETNNKWKSQRAEFTAEMIKNPNPESWLDGSKNFEGYDQRAKSWKDDAFGADYMPPAVKRRLESDWGKFDTDARSKIIVQASNLMVEQAKSAWGVQLDQAQLDGDIGEYSQILQQGVEDGYIPQNKATFEIAKEEKRINRKNSAHLAATNPKLWFEVNKGPGDDPAAYNANYRTANAVLSRTRTKNLTDVQNGIFEGEYSSKKEMVEAAKSLDVGGKAIHSLKATYESHKDATVEEFNNSPRRQKKNIGKLTRLIDKYEPNGKNEDGPLIDILQKIALINDPKTKSMFQGRLLDVQQQYVNNEKDRLKLQKEARERNIELDKIRQEEADEKKDRLVKKADEESKESAGDKLNYINALIEKSPPLTPEPQELNNGKTIKAYLDDGQLEDDSMLVRFGYQEKHAEEIAEAAKKERKADTSDLRYVGPSSIDLLQRYWGEGISAEKNFDPTLRAFYTAIRNGAALTTVIYNPEDQAAYDEGKARHDNDEPFYRGEFLVAAKQYLEDDPNVTKQEMEGFVALYRSEFKVRQSGANLFPDQAKQAEDNQKKEFGGYNASLFPVNKKIKPHLSKLEDAASGMIFDQPLFIAIASAQAHATTEADSKKHKNIFGMLDEEGELYTFESYEAGIVSMKFFLEERLEGEHTLKEIASFLQNSPVIKNLPNKKWINALVGQLDNFEQLKSSDTILFKNK